MGMSGEGCDGNMGSRTGQCLTPSATTTTAPGGGDNEDVVDLEGKVRPHP